ncbi:MAG TPA: xanthine dehydrogenase family protein subunit M [Candidatus Binataceae bacterium]|jgi:xanthine dehydrogenase YagS FAD-binding subunit|nr:xanthine dehydrogenase family protein subunit M [Candidatus Binataceae bacterium]
MRPFIFDQIRSPNEAFAASTGSASYLAGGTTLFDLMKLDVMQPERVVDINPLEQTGAGQIEVSDKGLHLGSLVRMADAADHPDIREQYPVIAQTLMLAASQQIRNMASLGGNVLQRTRCTYFRDTSYAACNKRSPGSGCAALTGFNRSHAVLGTSDNCIATYAGDFAQALIALDATVETAGPGGGRTLSFASLHRRPEKTPDKEANLQPNELITGFTVPAKPWTKRSLYLKIRDRESYEFALASAAVALHMENANVRDARIALGGVATVPWRSIEAEASLQGKSLDDATLRSAADAAFSDAKGYGHNDFKITLGKQTLIRALKQVAAIEI